MFWFLCPVSFLLGYWRTMTRKEMVGRLWDRAMQVKLLLVPIPGDAVFVKLGCHWDDLHLTRTHAVT